MRLFLDLLTEVVIGKLFHLRLIHKAVLFSNTANETIFTHAGEFQEILVPGVDSIVSQGPDGGGAHQVFRLDQHTVHIEQNCLIIHRNLKLRR